MKSKSLKSFIKVGIFVLACLMLITMFFGCVPDDDTDEGPLENEPVQNTELSPIFKTKEIKGGLAITGIKDSYSSDTVDIPETIKEYQVIEIADEAFEENVKIKTVNIPKSVKRINEEAFHECTNLETVNFAEGSRLEFIGEDAFSESGIKNITLPDSVTTIWYYAFFDCKNLTSINIPAALSWVQYGFIGYNNLTEIKLPTDSDFVVENGILYNKDKTEIVSLLGGIGISEYTMPDSVEIVHDYAFAGSDLSKIQFSNHLHRIKWGAFENCKKLTSIHLPPSLRSVGADAFKDCEKLQYVLFESEVVPDLGWNIFDGNAAGRKIYVPGVAKHDYLSNERLEEYRFGGVRVITSKIYFETNGGEEIEPMDAEYNNGITLPTPKKAGYVFNGWFFDEELTDRFYSSRWYADSDTTLYAGWIPTSLS